MENLENDIKKVPVQPPVDPTEITNEAEEEIVKSGDTLEDDIIRNDTIPETNSDTPGSIGAFPVGAFDNSKD